MAVDLDEAAVTHPLDPLAPDEISTATDILEAEWDVADEAVVTAGSHVTGDIREPGVYSSTLRAMPAAEWRKQLALLRKLDRMEKRLRRLERGDGEESC